MNDETMDILTGCLILGLGTLAGYFGVKCHYYKQYKKLADERMEMLEEAISDTEDAIDTCIQLYEMIDPIGATKIKKDIKKMDFTVLSNEES